MVETEGERPSRRSRRSRSSGEASSDLVVVPTRSEHPMSPTVDAETQEFALLQAYIPSSQKDASSNFEAILDFINVTDEKIDQLFVTNRIRHRDHDNVRYPPAGERRTASQIRQWFKYPVSEQKRRITAWEAE